MYRFNVTLFYIYRNVLQMCMLHEIVDHFDNILINEIGSGCVYHYRGVRRYAFEFVLNDRFVQE